MSNVHGPSGEQITTGMPRRRCGKADCPDQRCARTCRKVPGRFVLAAVADLSLYGGQRPADQLGSRPSSIRPAYQAQLKWQKAEGPRSKVEKSQLSPDRQFQRWRCPAANLFAALRAIEQTSCQVFSMASGVGYIAKNSVFA